MDTTLEQLLGPVSTRNLLICLLWVLKNVDEELLSQWWNSLSITRLNLLISVLDLCVSCFEYKVQEVVPLVQLVVISMTFRESRTCPVSRTQVLQRIPRAMT